MEKHDAPLRNEDVRQKNEKLILQAIQKNNGLSQSEVVSLTGLKAPTVLRIFSYLEERGLIVVAEDIDHKQTDKKGRKPVYYVVNSEAHYAVGIEFWARQISIIITDFQKQLVYEKTIQYEELISSMMVMDMLIRLIREALDSTGVPSRAVLGIGVGAPGCINTEEGTVVYYGRIQNMFELPLREQLEKRFGIPVFINNNASVAAVNAYRRGVARDSRALITILIRSGVGGAFINEGDLMVVKGRTAMEIGHSVIDINGPRCVCGANGCLEAYISEQVVREEARSIAGVETLRDFDRLLGEGDPAAAALAEEKGRLLAVEVRNLNRIFSPDSFLIMTRFPNLSSRYAEQARTILKTDFFCREREVAVYSDVYDSVEAGRGAADLVFEDYFS